MSQLSDIQQRISADAASIVEGRGGFLVDVQVRRDRGGVLVQVFADTDAGITIDECAQISRELRPLLNRDTEIGEAYRLEVSSPGLERPLRLLRQYHKNVGRRFQVQARMGDETASFQGVLEAVEGTTLVFTRDTGETVKLAFDDIVQSKEQLPW